MDPYREIERKFLLARMPDGLTSYPHGKIEQGYLALERGGVQVRLRRKDGACSLTYKRDDQGAREEREIKLSAEQFEILWPGTSERRLTKTRYDVPWCEHIIEVDVYTGRHQGVVVAEVEFKDDESCRAFVPPDWIGADVTGDSSYSNVVMAGQ